MPADDAGFVATVVWRQHAQVSNIVRRAVEIAAQHGGGGPRFGRERAGAGLAQAGLAGVLAGLAVPGTQRVGLGSALMRRVVLQVGADHAQATLSRHYRRLQRHTRHRRDGWVGGPGQGVAKHFEQGQAGGNEIAELAWRAVYGEAVHRWRVEDPVAGQERRQLGHLVGSRLACEVGVAARHLLQAEYVGVGDRVQRPDGAGQVDAPVGATTPLDVPGNQFHVAPCSVAAARGAGVLCRECHARAAPMLRLSRALVPVFMPPGLPQGRPAVRLDYNRAFTKQYVRFPRCLKP